ncbi:MAG: PLD nuclease N-terminal domain-containing protein [Buchananella hordeovulneris]|nr:PLD nuclease N-terminal domain-containing protein [Buchananella hordeovulneris]
MRQLIYLLPLILTIYALVDVVRKDEERVAGFPRVAWILIIAFLQPAIGAAVWLIVTKVLPRIQAEREARGAAAEPGRPGGLGALIGFQRAEEEPVQLAPDDDPEFLFRLKAEEQRRRRAARDAAMKEQQRRDLLRPHRQGDDASTGRNATNAPGEPPKGEQAYGGQADGAEDAPQG